MSRPDYDNIGAMFGQGDENLEELSEEELTNRIMEDEDEEELGEFDEDENEVEESVEEQEIKETAHTEPDPYAELLDRFNTQSRELLELKSRTGATSAPAEKSVEAPVVQTRAPAKFEKLAIDKNLLQKALTEDDSEAMAQVVDQLQDHFLGGMPTAEALQGTIMQAIMPKMIEAVTQHINTQNVIQNFYKENSDFQRFTPIISLIAEEIANKNPDKSLSEVLSMTEVEARRQLRLKKVTIPNSANGKNKNNPAFARSSSTRKGVVSGKPTGLKGEISDMLSAKR
jgi:hypothetical protein